jgi:hypothetical protein
VVITLSLLILCDFIVRTSGQSLIPLYVTVSVIRSAVCLSESVCLSVCLSLSLSLSLALSSRDVYGEDLCLAYKKAQHSTLRALSLSLSLSLTFFL